MQCLPKPQAFAHPLGTRLGPRRTLREPGQFVIQCCCREQRSASDQCCAGLARCNPTTNGGHVATPSEWTRGLVDPRAALCSVLSIDQLGFVSCCAKDSCEIGGGHVVRGIMLR